MEWIRKQLANQTIFKAEIDRVPELGKVEAIWAEIIQQCRVFVELPSCFRFELWGDSGKIVIYPVALSNGTKAPVIAFEIVCREYQRFVNSQIHSSLPIETADEEVTEFEAQIWNNFTSFKLSELRLGLKPILVKWCLPQDDEVFAEVHVA